MSGRRVLTHLPGPRPSPFWEGVLVVDKPAGMTSNRVLQILRKISGIQKMGHLGTLDPIATGVLPVCIGWATKIVPFIPDHPKGYRAVMVLGKKTDTQDLTGRVIQCSDRELPDTAEIERVSREFLGTQEQVPPSYSALKYKGKPLYYWARKGVMVTKPPRRITIEGIQILQREGQRVVFEVFCSPGTYVRTLCQDMGDRLGCGAYLESLRRIQSGPFRVEQAASLERIQTAAEKGELEELKIPLDRILSHLPQIWVRAEWKERIQQGRLLTQEQGVVPWPRIEPGVPVCVKGPKDELWAIYQQAETPRPALKPIRVMI